MKRKNNERLASELASELWNNSTLRHGMFTPPEFRKLCEEIIVKRLDAKHVETRIVKDEETLEEGDLIHTVLMIDTWMPTAHYPEDPPSVVGMTKFCKEGCYRRPISS